MSREYDNATHSAGRDPRLAEIKHSFFAMRNGIVADTLRKAGMEYKTIFGLQLPQLSEIARVYGKDEVLASLLWNDTDVRESRLLACWLMPPEAPAADEAIAMGRSTGTREEADILAFRMLRHRHDAADIAKALAGDSNPCAAYLAEAIDRNLKAMS